MEPQFIEIAEDEYNALQEELCELRDELHYPEARARALEEEIDMLNEQIEDLKGL